MKTLLVAACALGLAGGYPVSAQETPGDVAGRLSVLRSQFDELSTDLASAQETFDNRYADELKKLEQQATASGDLPLVIAVREEAKEFAGRGGEAATSPHPQLQRMQKIYAEQTARIASEQEAKKRSLMKGYWTQLTELRTELTKAGDIDSALKVQQEMDRLKSGAPLVAEVSRPAPPSSPAPTGRPGFGERPPRAVKSLADLVGHTAVIEVEKMAPVPIVEAASKDKPTWISIPEGLSANGALVFHPTGGTGGMTRYKVTTGGYAMLACNFAYQGNSSGGWAESRWTADQFRKNGWKQFSEEELGGKLTKQDKREQVIFYKMLEAGETGELRCNKYDPPYFIIFGR